MSDDKDDSGMDLSGSEGSARYVSDDGEQGDRGSSWDSRRRYLNSKYEKELEQAQSMSPEALRRLRR
jgi:hypothetical protein